jgi:DNA-binding response OmpR family regulator
MMPEMGGKELCHIIKTNFQTSHIPVIMITALSDLDTKIEGSGNWCRCLLRETI